MNRIYPNLAERILAHIKLVDPPFGITGKCWIWQGCKSKKGYGRITIRVNGKPIGHGVHRVAYEIWTGKKIAPGLHLDHRCNRESCCNPQHLEEVTNEENTKRRESRKRERCWV